MANEHADRVPLAEEKEKGILLERWQEMLQQELKAQCSAAMRYVQIAEQSTVGDELTTSHPKNPADSFTGRGDNREEEHSDASKRGLLKENAHLPKADRRCLNLGYPDEDTSVRSCEDAEAQCSLESWFKETSQQAGVDPELLRCPCGKPMRRPMFPCARCSRYVHLRCVKSQFTDTENFVCSLCFTSSLGGDSTVRDDSGAIESAPLSADRRINRLQGSEQRSLGGDDREPGNENSGRGHSESTSIPVRQRAARPPGKEQSPHRIENCDDGKGSGSGDFTKLAAIADTDKAAPPLCAVCDCPARNEEGFSVLSGCKTYKELMHISCSGLPSAAMLERSPCGPCQEEQEERIEARKCSVVFALMQMAQTAG